MTEKTNLRVGISIGDINGIGAEVVLKTFENTQMLDFCTPIIFATSKMITALKKQFDLTFAFNGINNLNAVLERKINIMNCTHESPNLEFGSATEEAGKFAFVSLEKSVEALKKGQIDVLVTAPINKKNIQSEEFHFPGHTDYLAKELNGESLMFLVSEELRVGLLTDHIPLKEVASHITEELIFKKVRLMEKSLIQDFGIQKPKIAILGLNPHCGDQGVIGKEDDTIILPAVEKLRQEGKLVFGPYSSDSFFVSEYKYFDAILAPYHDQGLIPFKMLSFGRGVNYTAGLDFVRTSPDHGTAYGIAGKGIADENSFRQAVFTAIDIYRKRRQYEEMTANPLQPQNAEERKPEK